MLAAGQTDPDGTVLAPNGRGRYVWKRKGIWKAGALERYGQPGKTPPPTAGEVKAMNELLDALAAILKATPTAEASTGWWMKESRGYTYPDALEWPGEMPMARVPFQIATGFFPFYLFDRLDKGGFVPDWTGETESVYFAFNSLPGPVKQPVVLKENGARVVEFYPQPQETGRMGGFPIYDGQTLLLARAGRDVWAAAGLERVLRAAMPEYTKDRETAERRLADLKKQNDETQAPAYEEKMRAHLEKVSGALRTSNPGKWQGRVTGMENELKYNRELAAKRANPQRDKDGAWYWNPVDAHAEAAKQLAAMTPEEGRKQACYLAAADKNGRYAMQGKIVAAGTGNCQPLVMNNYEYFDGKLARSVPQLLRVDVGRCAWRMGGKWTATNRPRNDAPPQGCEVHVPMWAEMDWKKVGALVVP
jgi:hypothetical protein